MHYFDDDSFEFQVLRVQPQKFIIFNISFFTFRKWFLLCSTFFLRGIDVLYTTLKLKIFSVINKTKKKVTRNVIYILLVQIFVENYEFHSRQFVDRDDFFFLILVSSNYKFHFYYIVACFSILEWKETKRLKHVCKILKVNISPTQSTYPLSTLLIPLKQSDVRL